MIKIVLLSVLANGNQYREMIFEATDWKNHWKCLIQYVHNLVASFDFSIPNRFEWMNFHAKIQHYNFGYFYARKFKLLKKTHFFQFFTISISKLFLKRKKTWIFIEFWTFSRENSNRHLMKINANCIIIACPNYFETITKLLCRPMERK